METNYKIAEINNRKLLALRPLAAETLKSLRDYYRVGLTFSSNALEGNSLTESETKVVIEDSLAIISGGVNTKDGGVKVSDVNEIGGVNSLDLQLMQTIQTIQTLPGLNAPALAIESNKSLRTVQRYLKKLMDEGKIEFKGAPKNGGYYIKQNKET